MIGGAQRCEQRYQAVLEVLNHGATVTDVARRNGVTRQTLYAWLHKYASHGLAGLADGSAKPLSCPHQMTAEVEARVVTIRGDHPGWGQRTIQHQLGHEGVVPLPTLSSIYQCHADRGGCGCSEKEQLRTLISCRSTSPTRSKLPGSNANAPTDHSAAG